MKKLLIASVLALLICVSTAKVDAESYSDSDNRPMCSRVDELEQRIDELEDTIDSLIEKVNALNNRLDARQFVGAKFYKGQTVYDIVKGKGVVTENLYSEEIIHPVVVKFPHYAEEYLYTRDGKFYSGDLFPSLYDKEMKVVPK